MLESLLTAVACLFLVLVLVYVLAMAKAATILWFLGPRGGCLWAKKTRQHWASPPKEV